MEDFETHYLCPIDKQIMEDPVIAADGHTYERAAIQAWLAAHRTSPVTNAPLSDNKLIPNYTLKSWIIAQRERLRKAQKCFRPFEELESRLQETLKTKSGKEQVQTEWDRRNDLEKLKWLEEIGLKGESYSYIKVEFKQFLSDITQGQRHFMAENGGKHPSTEEFWKFATEMHEEWVAKMNQKEN